MFEEVSLGDGTNIRAGRFGNAFIVDSELRLLGHETNGDDLHVKFRIPLGEEPLEFVASMFNVALHFPGRIDVYNYYSTTKITVPVGDGVLLPSSRDDQPTFFDGTTFTTLDTTATTATLGHPITPDADQLAAIGMPRAKFRDTVFGDRGFLAVGDTVAGPGFAHFADIFGDAAATLGPMAADATAYVIRFGDGTAKLYDAPFSGWCD